MASSQKYIAVVGAGYWGKNLVRVFNELAAIKTICDVNDKLLKERVKEYPHIITTEHFNDIIDDKDIKGVVVATPAATHYSLAKKILEAGKDIFVEKPLALNMDEGSELVELAKKRKRILMVGHLLLYHPAFRELKTIIDNGTMGEIHYIRSTRLNFGKLRKEENVLWSFAPHDISLIIDIMGMPRNVRAIGKAFLQKDIADTTLTSLEFHHNRGAHIFVSWIHPFKEQNFSVVGSKAMAVFDDQAKEKLVVYRHKVEWHERETPTAIKAGREVISLPETEPLLEEAKIFLDAIKTRKQPKSDGKEALGVLRVLTACQRSLTLNGVAVTV